MVVTDDGNFPTDRFVLAGLAAARGLARCGSCPTDPSVADVEAAVAAGDVALLSLSLVAYRTGALARPRRGITAAAHRHGALVLWDLCHAAGAVRSTSTAAGADLAVGCSYKYLNGGPGAPAFLYVRPRPARPSCVSPSGAGSAQRDQFAMGPAYVPADGIDRFQVGTPPVLGLVAVDEGVALTAAAGMVAIDAKRRALLELVLTHVDAVLAPLGVEVATPRESARQGSHVALRHPEAWRITRALVEECGVVPDFREPDLIRVGLTPLHLRFVDAWDAVDRLREVLVRRRFEGYADERARIT